MIALIRLSGLWRRGLRDRVCVTQSRSGPGVMQRERDTLMLQSMHDVMSRDHNIPTLIDPRSGRDLRERESVNMGRGPGAVTIGGGGQRADSWSRGHGGSGAMQTPEAAPSPAWTEESGINVSRWW